MTAEILGRLPIYLLDTTARGGALLAVAGLAALLLRRRTTASERFLVWAGGLGGLGLVTLVAWALPAWRVAGLARPLVVTGLAGGGPAPGTPAVVAGPDPSGLGAAAPALGGEGGISLAGDFWAVLGALWLAVALLLLVRLAAGVWSSARLVRRARPERRGELAQLADELAAGMGLARATLAFSGEIGGPLTAGLVRPVVLLPLEARAWPIDRLRAVLTHELAHVARRDCAVQMLARVVVALHWWNPLAWLAERRLAAEREVACDDHVLAGGTRASSYADHLLAVRRLLIARGHAAGDGLPAAIPILGGATLAARIEGLLDARRDHRLPARRAWLRAALLTLALALPAACLDGQSPAGRSELRLTYRTPPAERDLAALVLGRRLDGLNLSGARVLRAGEDGLTVVVPDLAPERRAAVRQALERSGAFAFTVVETDGELARTLAAHATQDPEARRLGIEVKTEVWRARADGSPRTERHLQGPGAVLQRYLAGLPPALAAATDGRVLLEAPSGAAGQSRTWVLDPARRVQLSRPAVAEIETQDPTAPSTFAVALTLQAPDAVLLHRLTAANVGQRLAITLDRELWGAPVIQSPFGERVVVTAQGPRAEAEQLAAVVHAGPLPAPLAPVADR